MIMPMVTNNEAPYVCCTMQFYIHVTILHLREISRKYLKGQILFRKFTSIWIQDIFGKNSVTNMKAGVTLVKDVFNHPNN